MQPQIAFAKTFMDSYSRLPKQQQKRARDLIEKFQRDPERAGINFERIAGATDDKVRSLRVDQAYRAIVVHPPKGDVYLYVWVANHDDAYDWVRHKRFEVNPKSGIFQLYDMDVVDEFAGTPEESAIPSSRPADTLPGLFDDQDDEDLLLIGVPQPLLPTVRALKTEAQFEELAPYLPEDAAEMLLMLAAGYSLLEAIEESGRPKEQQAVDTTDFSTALEKPESQRAFRIIDGEKELEQMLDAPLEKWRTFLHPSQRRIIRMRTNGPARVLGGAGTGKTVVLMHRAKFLLENVFPNPDDRLLVTTYTRNLALDLESHLRTLCGDQAHRLEVINLHAWAKRYMQSLGFGFVPIDQATKQRLMDQAVSEADDLNLLTSFYLDEWDHVAQAQEVLTRDDYFRARRVGRGTRLSRAQKARVWRVLSRYRELLEARSLTEWPDLVRESRLVIQRKELPLRYAAVLADEVQDFSASDLRLLRAIAPEGQDTLFVVGDGHQRIYGQPVALSQCGIEIRGRAHRLRVNYRTTEQIGRKALSILTGLNIDDLDGGLDSLKGYSSVRSGPAPDVRYFARESDEADFIIQTIKQWVAEGVGLESICIAARTNSQVNDRYIPILKQAEFPTVAIRRDPETEARRQGIRLATMHRMKGLEFPRVILAGTQRGKMPLAAGEYADNASLEDHELKERCLLYVAATRARDALVITGFGEPSPFLE